MDSEYVISRYIQDGLIFEMIIGQVEVGLVEQGQIGEIITEPRIRITKVPDASSTSST